jgi:D-hydroxyproline dehydrogenase subunit alpha
VLSVQNGDGAFRVDYKKLILATGAREQFLPFPGWTLPNVFGAGGLDAMVRGGLPVSGKRVAVAGTGPLLLAVAAHLAKRGAKIVALCEQAPFGRLAAFASRLLTQPGKLAQAAAYRWALRNTTMHFGCWVSAAHGTETVERATLRQGEHDWTIDCDYLACGYHLVPNTELARLLGCHVDGEFVAVDALQQTSQPDIFCAGEPTGIGGVELALLEGEIAGLAAAGEARRAQVLAARRRGMLGFVRALGEAYALDPRLRELARPETIVCRCEDVTFAAMCEHANWRDAKLHTRCGMGPCQGRICGAASAFLFGWNADSVRPPIFPAPVASFMRAGASYNDSEEDL